MNVFRLLRWRSPYTHPQSLQSLGTNHHLTVGRNNRYLTTKSDSIEDGELAYAKFGHFVDSGESDRSNKVKFVERVQIEVKAGKGGNGCISHEVLSPGKKRPNGGNGGKGGNVYVVGSNQIETLHFPTYHFNAGDGKHGGSNGMTGRNGKDVYIHVPLGTIITENIPEEFAEYFYYDYSNEIDDHDDGDYDFSGDEATANIVSNHALEMTGDEALNQHTDITFDGTQNKVRLAWDVEDEGNDDDDDDDYDDDESKSGWAIDDDDDDEHQDAAEMEHGANNEVSVRTQRKRHRRRKKRHIEKHYSVEGPSSDDEFELLPAMRLEIMKDGETYALARGGEFGIGNKVLAGSSKHRTRSLPQSRTPGRPGEQRSFHLELKLIADVGLVGYPNAGKSTLLRCVSNAKPRVAPYHFTTLRPYLGVMHFPEIKQQNKHDSGNNNDHHQHMRITIADIPGLIEGAHLDRGLGHTFLKHIERTKMLVYVLDGASTEGRDPADDLISLMDELRLYNAELLKKPALVFANKADIEETFYKKHDLNMCANQVEGEKRGDSFTRLEKVASTAGLAVVDGSANKGDGITELASMMRRVLAV